MARLMTFDDAVRYLKLMCAADEEPALSDSNISDLLALAACPDGGCGSPRNVSAVGAWQTSHTYAPGDLVQADGRFWRALVAGTSGTSMPAFPALLYSPTTTAQVVDNEVVWQDNGATWAPTYDLNKAAAEGWMIKAGKVAHKYDFSAGGQMFTRNQFQAHCLEMADRYRKRGLGMIEVSDSAGPSVNADTARFLGLV